MVAKRRKERDALEGAKRAGGEGVSVCISTGSFHCGWVSWTPDISLSLESCIPGSSSYSCKRQKLAKRGRTNDNQPFKVKIIAYLKTYCSEKGEKSCDHSSTWRMQGGRECAEGQSTQTPAWSCTHAEPTAARTAVFPQLRGKSKGHKKQDLAAAA